MEDECKRGESICVCVRACERVCVEGVQMEAKYNGFVTGKGSDS